MVMKNTKVDDIYLIRLIVRAQSEALNELYERYNRLVFSVAYAIVGDKNIAEEITLDVFVQVWKHARTYQPERGKVSTWLIAITRHHAIDILRWQKSRPQTDSLNWEGISLQDGPAAHNVEENVELSVQRERVREALDQLPEEQREVLVLAYFRGYTQSQISEALLQPLGTIKTRIRLAMQKLRNLLDEN